MNWLSRLFSRRQVYDDLSEEIQSHLEQKVDELVASGVSREEAEFQARREFGNVSLTEENGREVWIWPTLESILADVKFALRQLRNPRAPLHCSRRCGLRSGGHHQPTSRTTILAWRKSVGYTFQGPRPKRT